MSTHVVIQSRPLWVLWAIESVLLVQRAGLLLPRPSDVLRTHERCCKSIPPPSIGSTYASATRSTLVGDREGNFGLFENQGNNIVQTVYNIKKGLGKRIKSVYIAGQLLAMTLSQTLCSTMCRVTAMTTSPNGEEVRRCSLVGSEQLP